MASLRMARIAAWAVAVAVAVLGLAEAAWGRSFWGTWREAQRLIQEKAASAAQRPNIIFIILDDTDSKLGSVDRKVIPKTRSLIADQGADLTNYFVNFAVCCPSRVSYLTGRCSHNTGVVWNTNSGYLGGEYRFLEQGHENFTIAAALQAAGYRTGLHGKYLNGYGFNTRDPLTNATLDGARIPKGWNNWWSFIDIGFFNYSASNNGTKTSYGNSSEEYSTDVIRNKTIEFIRQYQNDPRPFFAYVAPYAAHAPFVPAPRHEGKFNKSYVPRTLNFLGLYPTLNQKVTGIKYYPRFQKEFVPFFDLIYQKRLETLQAVDELVEAIVNELQAQGILNNTYIFFTADNGYHIGHHRLTSGKTTPYEEDIHLFFFARGPGIAPGITLPHLFGNIDLASTVADLAGAPFPLPGGGPPDGISFAPFLVNATVRALDKDHFRAGFLVEKIATDSSPIFVGPQIAGRGLSDDPFAKYRRPYGPFASDAEFYAPKQPYIKISEPQYVGNQVNKGAELTDDGVALLNTTYGNSEGHGAEGLRYFNKLGFNSSFQLTAIGSQFPSTYYALRLSNKWLGDFLYLETRSGHEAYNITTDPYQTLNIYTSLSPALIGYLQAFLDHLKTCRGPIACNPRAFIWPARPYPFP